mmetsp:Transcript_17779/g.53538  ORF Transcript_17779/g.53538 Transcript_17779/m.53538 type:complete len:289 (-) Transcript_17779:571-1437(-)
MNNARAKLIRMRHPPENELVARCCIFSSNPRPLRILEASASAVWWPSSWSSSYTSVKRAAASSSSRSAACPSPPSGGVAPLPPAPLASGAAGSPSSEMSPRRRFNSASSSLSSISLPFADTTAWTADCSVPTTSCSTNRTSNPAGTGSRRFMMRCSRVDLPMPLGPTSPYLRPAVMFTSVFSSSSFPLTRTVILTTLMSVADTTSPAAPPWDSKLTSNASSSVSLSASAFRRAACSSCFRVFSFSFFFSRSVILTLSSRVGSFSSATKPWCRSSSSESLEDGRSISCM